jgi:hypothetical protein
MPASNRSNRRARGSATGEIGSYVKNALAIGACLDLRMDRVWSDVDFRRPTDGAEQDESLVERRNVPQGGEHPVLRRSDEFTPGFYSPRRADFRLRRAGANSHERPKWRGSVRRSGASPSRDVVAEQHPLAPGVRRRGSSGTTKRARRGTAELKALAPPERDRAANNWESCILVACRCVMCQCRQQSRGERCNWGLYTVGAGGRISAVSSVITPGSPTLGAVLARHDQMGGDSVAAFRFAKSRTDPGRGAA